jgi:hypothetical protein
MSVRRTEVEAVTEADVKKGVGDESLGDESLGDESVGVGESPVKTWA